MHSSKSQAAHIISTLYAAATNDEKLAQKLRVRATGWSEDHATAIFTGLEDMLRAGRAPMGQAMNAAYDKASHVVTTVLGFTREHPVFCTVVALGILVILLPWVIEVLGFGELGPIEGTFAAWWQSRYAGYVPARSLFSVFQRLGMVWGRKFLI